MLLITEYNQMTYLKSTILHFALYVLLFNLCTLQDNVRNRKHALLIK